jgi:broad specificity phosphatase PhoE
VTAATRLLLVRHAEVEARYHRVFGGCVDMDLSPLGHMQAVTLADYLRRKPLDAIYASPMKRVQQTLAPFLNNGGPLPVIFPSLREVDLGDWTGHAWSAVHEKFGVSAFEWLAQLEHGAIPNAETGATFRARVEPCLREILRKHPGQSVAVFCHGGVIRMIVSILLELPLSRMSAFDFEYASVSEIEWQPHRTEIQLLNFTPWRDLSSQTS